MNTSRRDFFKTGALSAGALAFFGDRTSAADSAKSPSFLVKPPRMRLGTVTYNLAQDWDIETIIKNCEGANFDGVELRTGHAHKVEVTLSKDEREKVKTRFANS